MNANLTALFAARNQTRDLIAVMREAGMKVPRQLMDESERIDREIEAAGRNLSTQKN